MVEHSILFFIALLANTFSAISGGGAGLIQFPILLFLGLSFAVALATHKIASVALGLGAAIRYYRNGNLDRHLIILLLLCGVPGVMMGAYGIIYLPQKYAEIALALMTGSLGLYSIFRPQLGQQAQPKHRGPIGWTVGAMLLFVLAVLNGSLSSGTGLLVTITLIIWFGLSYQQAIAMTLVMVGFIWNGIGAVTLGIFSTVYWLWLPPLLLGALIGGYFGSYLATRMNNRWIKRFFELMAIMIAISLFVKAYSHP